MCSSDLNDLIMARSPQGPQRTPALGFSIIGMSGMGKTTAIEEILSLYPQVIVHEQFRGKPFPFQQLVWLHMDCSPNGSLRGLCLDFLKVVDAILGTNYLKTYARGRATADSLILDIATVASNHNIGVLVLDEIQNADAASSGGRDSLMNALVHLTNTIGVPITYVGTFASWGLLTRQFRQIRRGSGQGDLVWDRMAPDGEDWSSLVEAMWNFQYVRRVTPLTQELRTVLYEETQGITDYAIKVFMMAQWRAITTGKEQILPSIIRSVAHDSLRQSRQVLDALRSGIIPQDLATMKDLRPPDMSCFSNDVDSKDKAVATLDPAPNADSPSVEKKSTAKKSPRKRSETNGNLKGNEKLAATSSGNSDTPSTQSQASCPQNPEANQAATTQPMTPSTPPEPSLRELAEQWKRNGTDLGHGIHGAGLGFQDAPPC